jgi:hypothetical protein
MGLDVIWKVSKKYGRNSSTSTLTVELIAAPISFWSERHELEYF